MNERVTTYKEKNVERAEEIRQEEVANLRAYLASPAYKGASKFYDYEAYVNNYPDLLAAFNKDQSGITLEDFGREHWENVGVRSDNDFEMVQDLPFEQVPDYSAYVDEFSDVTNRYNSLLLSYDPNYIDNDRNPFYTKTQINDQSGNKYNSKLYQSTFNYNKKEKSLKFQGFPLNDARRANEQTLLMSMILLQMENLI